MAFSTEPLMSPLTSRLSMFSATILRQLRRFDSVSTGASDNRFTAMRPLGIVSAVCSRF